MDSRDYWRFRKFYTSQVEKIISLLDRQFSEGQIEVDTYLKICEQTGEVPDERKLPPEIGQYPTEVQEAFLIHGLLPDRWEGMSGYYMGKDMSALKALLDIYEIKDKKVVVYFLKHIESKHSDYVNKKQDKKRKAAESAAKAKGKLNTPTRKR